MAACAADTRPGGAPSLCSQQHSAAPALEHGLQTVLHPQQTAWRKNLEAVRIREPQIAAGFAFCPHLPQERSSRLLCASHA